jgi:glycosyltransferase involved in cell wall biosynthesis
MRKGKVCVITSSHNPFDTRIFKKECRSLVEAGYDVTLLAPTDEVEQDVEGVRVLGFGGLKSRWGRIGNLLTIGRMARALRADIYHVHEPELLLLLPLIRLSLPRAQFIYDVHENYADSIVSGEKHWIAAPLKPFVARAMDIVEKFLSRRVDLVVAASPDIEINFKGCNTISVKNFAPMYIINRVYMDKSARPETDMKREIVYTGSLTRTRGILEIVKALELIDPRFDVRLTVTGKFHDPGLKKEVEKLPGYNRTDFLGWLPDFEAMVAKIINADAAMVCFHPDPNLNNAVERSNKLFEYMGMGLPIIVSDLPEWAGLIKRHHCGLVVDPLDPADISKKAGYLFSHPREALEMGLNGRKAVLENYSWEGEGRKLAEAYKALLSGMTGEGDKHSDV